jgi:peptidylprolyl isomerase
MTRVARWALPAVLTLATALSACGSDSSSTAGGASSPAATPAATPSSSAPAAAASTPPAGSAYCLTQSGAPVVAQKIAAPQGIGSDLRTRPKVPADPGTPPAELQVADVVTGTGAAVKPGDKVAVKYVGAIDKTGKEFDASWNKGPSETLPFTACGGQVVPGFSLSPVGMKVGGRRLVRIPDRYGYAGGNAQAGIAAGDVITFVIDLTKIG